MTWTERDYFSVVFNYFSLMLMIQRAAVERLMDDYCELTEVCV